MSNQNSKQRLVLLSAILSVGLLGHSVLANAATMTESTPSRVGMIVNTLTPESRKAGTQGSGNLVRRLVRSQDGIGLQNVLVNRKHSLDLAIFFEPGKATISNRARSVLMDLGRALSSPPLDRATWLIAGHTDASGGAKQNRRLSEQRARRIKAWLVRNYNINPDRLAIAGYGEQFPADRDNPEAAINRRIEISLITSGYTVPKRRFARLNSTRVRSNAFRVAGDFRAGARRFAPTRFARYNDRRFDDYNSDIFNPPTITGIFATARTGNTVCDSFEGVLTDPRPLHMELDDYDARTPATCPVAEEFPPSLKDTGFGSFSPEDDNELLK